MRMLALSIAVALASACSDAEAKCPSPQTALQPGCPWEQRLIDQRFSVAPIPADVEVTVIEAFNHEPYLGCIAKADKVLSAYSRYEDGFLIYIGKGNYLYAQKTDRVLLRDVIDRLATLRPPPQKPCPNQKPPPVIEYKMPDSANPMAKR